ncbi:hypothetical protein VTI28DRAFT_10172 [Corynascus sepedonium]
MKPFAIALQLIISTVVLAKKNLIIDTDLFSDVDDAGALLIATTSPSVNLLAVNINYPSSYSALAASAILAHYGKTHVPIGIPRPLTNTTFFDSWYFTLGEYTSKVAYHFSGGSLPWGRAEDARDPVALYRKVLAEADDGSVTIVSIGFLDNLSALLNSTADAHSPLPGRTLLARKLSELVIMGGSYPFTNSTGNSSTGSWNFVGSDPALAAHVVNDLADRSSWPPRVRVVYVGDDVGARVLTGGPLMAAATAAPGSQVKIKDRDPVGMAYAWYGYYTPRPSWDPLAVVYAIHGLEGPEEGGENGLFEFGNHRGYNSVDGRDGTNRWVWDEGVGNQFFLRLKVADERAAEVVDDLFMKGAFGTVGREGKQRRETRGCKLCGHEEL